MCKEHTLIIRRLGLQPYVPIWHAMQEFTNSRTEQTIDEVWLLQHEPVFTQGQAGKAEHLLMPGDIPVVHSDRGGQVTYHGPGQLIVYLLLDVKRHQLGPRSLVTAIETIVVDLLASYAITSYARPDAPGVYVEGAKIASLGLRIRHNASFHGFALNVRMNLEPFSRINPCGYAGLKMTQLSDLLVDVDMAEVTTRLIKQLISKLAYTNVTVVTNTEIG